MLESLRICRGALLVLLAAPALSAQVDVTVITQSQSFSTDTSWICPPVWDGQSGEPAVGDEIVSSFQRWCSGVGSVQLVTVTDSGVSVLCQAPPNGSIGGSGFRLHCTFDGVGSGQLVVSTSVQSVLVGGFGSSDARAEVDIGLDGIDVEDGANAVIPVRLDGSLTVEIDCSASFDCFPFPCSFQGSAGASIQFVPDPLPPPAAVQSYGASCGATLDVVDTPGPGVHELDFTVTGGLPNASALLAIGFEQTAIPIPLDPACTLNTSILVTGLLDTDASGTAVFGLTMFAPVTGTFYAQAFPFDLASGELETSPGVSVTLAD